MRRMRTRLQPLRILLALAGLVGSHGRAAETVTLGPSQDTYISEHFSGTNGLGTDMVIGTQGFRVGFGKNHGLLRFDGLLGIPTNAIITSVTVRLTVIKTPAGPDSNFDLHRMLQEWEERSSTWFARLPPDVAWAVPGGAESVDFSATVSASQ